jgi:hypothetical protein
MRAVRLAFSPARNNARSTGIASSGFLLTSLFFAADSTRAARFARLAGLLFARLLFMSPFLSAAAVDSNCRRSPMRQPRGDSGSESSANFRAKRLRTSAAGTLCPPCRTPDRILPQQVVPISKAKSDRASTRRTISLRTKRPAAIAASSGFSGESPPAIRSALMKLSTRNVIGQVFLRECCLARPIWTRDDQASRPDVSFDLCHLRPSIANGRYSPAQC